MQEKQTKQVKFIKYPPENNEEYIYISPEGYKKLLETYDPKDPLRNVVWTSDIDVELPIFLKQELGKQNFNMPMTIPQYFAQNLPRVSHLPALTYWRNEKWNKITYKEYYQRALDFGNALIALGVTELAAINIIGFNSPEWFFAFHGSIFAHTIPVGVYSTNNTGACKYIAIHSNCQIVVAENFIQAQKYLNILEELPQIKYIVIYGEEVSKMPVPSKYANKVISWDNFVKIGQNFKPSNPNDSIFQRINKCKPGQCATLIYTSGTTGAPKAVMLSHDNYVYSSIEIAKRFKYTYHQVGYFSTMSFLPLSHVVSQVIEFIAAIHVGGEIFIPASSALKNDLIKFLKMTKPRLLFAVPRIWEKIQEQMILIGAKSGAITKKIASWAKSIGTQGTFAESHNLPTPFGFGLAKKLVYNKIKKQLGFDNIDRFVVGAAPMSSSLRQFFTDINIFIITCYGMTEAGSAQTFGFDEDFNVYNEETMKSCGRLQPGMEIMILDPDEQGNGEICNKGRNRFLGYYKNPDATREVMESNGFFHSGDIGKLDQYGNLTVTGRIKDLVKTSGGENVTPSRIETKMKDQLNMISQVVVCGDQKKHLTLLLTMKLQMNEQGQFTQNLDKDAIEHLKLIGSKATTIEEARQCPKIKEAIIKAMEVTNQKAISRASEVHKYFILDTDFSIDNGELTPTLKVKRNVVFEKYKAQIENMYKEEKL